MYTQYFGFKERPFKLVPNPAFLFLSRNHEEALAHLAYAASQGDGFVEITGEVGTGKTTLCRAFLENLESNTQAAYIFNPKLDAVQLLKAINDEFGIPSTADNTKDLIDTLNLFLMEKIKEGQSVILIIDEAQNLSYGVLEQLRLISNLEITTRKLIQIVLVGQPELGEMLDSFELRQLSQRINLSCHLVPLSYAEMGSYIRHRIQIASQRPGVKFSTAALRRIYHYSKGVPRMINIACDRALLTAYSLNRKKITRAVAGTAIDELTTRGGRISMPPGWLTMAFSACVGICLTLLVLFSYSMIKSNELFDFINSKFVVFRNQSEPVKVLPNKGELQINPVNESEQVLKPDQRDERLGLADFLIQLDSEHSRKAAMAEVADLWGERGGDDTDEIDAAISFSSYFSRLNNMQIQRIQGDLQMLYKLNLPAILELYPPSASETTVYLMLAAMDASQVMFNSGNGKESFWISNKELQACWRGVAYLPWKDFFRFSDNISTDASKEDLILLKKILKLIGFKGLDPVPTYDPATKAVVEELQAVNGILVDGVVGSMTKIILYNRVEGLNIPHIHYDNQIHGFRDLSDQGGIDD